MFLLGRLLAKLIRRGRLEIITDGGNRHGFGPGGDGPRVTIRLHDGRVAGEIARSPALGTAEAYMDGRITVENGDIEQLLEVISLNSEWMDANLNAHWLRRSGRFLRSAYQKNRPRIAQRNVAHHYDLSARLYDLFLDVDRQYSCAYYRPGVVSLETAQHDKKAHIAAKLYLQPGQRVLDIGCGWGGMALYIASLDPSLKVTGITLSEEQLKIARDRAEEAGVSDRVDFRLIDYRELEGRFDRIVSVGMFEHVGTPQYQTFFDRVGDLLTDSGVALIHTIGRAEGPGVTDAFTRKYIFPGGYVPALSEIVPHIENRMLWITDIEVLRLHYARTLDAWLRRTRFARDEIVSLYDERFYRMWLFYLAGSKFAFERGTHMNLQIQIARRRDTLPITRDYMADAERRYLELGARQSAAEGAAMGSISKSGDPRSAV